MRIPLKEGRRHLVVAIERGMWQAGSTAALRDLHLDIETVLEARTES
jgi:hypothetical protein